jgi:hypothetical protein
MAGGVDLVVAEDAMAVAGDTVVVFVVDEDEIVPISGYQNTNITVSKSGRVCLMTSSNV